MRLLQTTPLLVITAGLVCACVGTHPRHEADAIDATLPIPADQVREAMIHVLVADGYEVREEDTGRLMTGYRREIQSPWDWMLRWRFGVGRSRVVATVIPTSEGTTLLTIRVSYEGKDSMFTAWEASPTPLPQSAANQLREIKNALRVL